MLFCSDNSFFLFPDVNVPVSHTLFPWFLYHPPCFHTWEGAAPDTHTNWREAESSPAERNLGVVGGGDNMRNGMELYHGAVMDLCQRKVRMGVTKRFFTRWWLGLEQAPQVASGHVTKLPDCSLSHAVWIWGASVWRWALKTTILVGLFQLGLFYDSVFLWMHGKSRMMITILWFLKKSFSFSDSGQTDVSFIDKKWCSLTQSRHRVGFFYKIVKISVFLFL